MERIRKMTTKEAFDIVHQLARAAPVNGDVGDKRDEALAVIKNMMEQANEPDPSHKD